MLPVIQALMQEEATARMPLSVDTFYADVVRLRRVVPSAVFRCPLACCAYQWWRLACFIVIDSAY